MKLIRLEPQYPLDLLTPHPLNYRVHDLDGLKRALKRGQHRTVAARAHDPEEPVAGATLLAGHGICQAARELGRKTIAVSVVECDDAEAEEIVVEDNRMQELGEDDPRLLGDLLARIHDRGHLEEIGYQEADLAALLTAAAPPPVLEPLPATFGPAAYEPPDHDRDDDDDQDDGDGLRPEPLTQVLLRFPDPGAHDAFMRQLGHLRERYGIEEPALTPVVVAAVHEQAEAVA